MSTRKRMSRNEHGEPVLVITVEGHSDIYRLARGMETLQVEFCDLGRRILAGLDRHRPGLVDDLTAYMGPSDPRRAPNAWKRHR